MRYTHIRRLDLGLLAALQALIEERSVSRAARRIHLSQPAMSRSFDRLQELFGDELLVRTQQGYEPTHRARHVYAELGRLLPRLETLLRRDEFNPATAADTFRIAATDYAVGVLFPPLMKQLGRLAPGMVLDICPWDDTVFGRLETNALDLALWVNAAPGELRYQVLFEEQFMCLVRPGHPVGRKPLTLERYLSFPHALVTLTRQKQELVDINLEQHGVRRNVRLRTPYFTSAAWIIEHSDMILTLPRRLARRLAKISRTRMVAPPAELAPFRYIQIWHPRLDHDPAHQWFRRLLAETSVGGRTRQRTLP